MKYQSIQWAMCCGLAIVGAFCEVGCEQPSLSVVTAVSAPQQVELSADDVVKVMRRAGFANQDIIEMGPQVRDSVAASGGVNITIGGKVQAILAVENGLLYVTARGRGTFIYRLDTHEFR